ncbi:hypothetical protein Adt_06141 [Abeliophyllum distichum]|uniref:Uncharacterized protein n=1 Tax=Abeliophyllum distichum TaxID=126358 RepID=A0ABD1V879_9LAMI
MDDTTSYTVNGATNHVTKDARNLIQKADYNDIAARRYRQYKAYVNAYIRDKGTIVPYRGLTTDVWEKCIECTTSKKFKLPTPPPPPPLLPMHEEELDSLNDDDYVSDL